MAPFNRHLLSLLHQVCPPSALGGWRSVRAGGGGGLEGSSSFSSSSAAAPSIFLVLLQLPVHWKESDPTLSNHCFKAGRGRARQDWSVGGDREGVRARQVNCLCNNIRDREREGGRESERERQKARQRERRREREQERETVQLLWVLSEWREFCRSFCQKLKVRSYNCGRRRQSPGVVLIRPLCFEAVAAVQCSTVEEPSGYNCCSGCSGCSAGAH